MSWISGTDPKHWHSPQGKHRMTDPRKIPGYPRRHWTPDEKAYVAHLEEHAEQAKHPEPQPGDSVAIHALFEHIASLEEAISTERGLITTLRLRALRAPGHDEKEN